MQPTEREKLTASAVEATESISPLCMAEAHRTNRPDLLRLRKLVLNSFSKLYCHRFSG
jgi:hypothetical protein